MASNKSAFSFIVFSAMILNGCATGPIVARLSLPVLESGKTAMNRESDLELARAAIPANLSMIEGLVQELPGDAGLRVQAAEALYGYAYGFVEDEDASRASALYRRGLEHALRALTSIGLKGDPKSLPTAELKARLDALGEGAVPALFWAGVCWAKWIDLNRNDPGRIAEVDRTAAIMRRVLEINETFNSGGAHLFFGVYYGSRPPMLGGDFEKSARAFDKARAVSHGKLLIADLLRAQYLARLQQDRAQFHALLTSVIQAPPDLYPEMGLANAIAQRKAKRLLSKEEELF